MVKSGNVESTVAETLRKSLLFKSCHSVDIIDNINSN